MKQHAPSIPPTAAAVCCVDAVLESSCTSVHTPVLRSSFLAFVSPQRVPKGVYCLLPLVLTVLTLSLGACSTVDDWMGKAEDPPLPGQRIAVMKAENTLHPDEEAAQVPITVPEAVTNEDWAQSGGKPDHVMGNLALSDNPRQVWSSGAGSGSSRRIRLTTPPIVAGGHVYTLDTEYQVTSFNASTGSSVWKMNAAPEDDSGDVTGGGLAMADNALVVTTGFAEVLVLDPGTGAVRWRKHVSAPLRGAPTVADGRILAITVDNQLVALSLENGTPLWTHTGIAETAGIVGNASPAVGDDTVVVAYSSGELYALNARNGRVAWTESLASLLGGSAVSNMSDIRGLPVMDDGLVLAVSHNGRMVAIDGRIGARVWEQSVGGLNTPWVAGDVVYVLSGENQLAALKRQDGKILWVTDLGLWEDPEDRSGRISMAGPVMGGGVLWVTSSTGEMLGINPENGAKMRTVSLPGPASQPPVIAGQTLYVLTDDATLAAYR
ncbi:MAG: PQQ-like beta-propeller repeat protein [Pseudomonadota bacterium]|nr:PQQ-like beta-propeller repeat protein [Pseudomonadota bacterium]